jgi:pimeloyl-ACP methyl ester carboxylesterase
MLYTLLFILGIIALAFLWFIQFGGPRLPKNIDTLIEEVKKEPLPKLITGDRGFAENDGVRIAYEIINPTGNVKGTVLLVHGLSSTLLDWPRYFFQPMLDEGYRVIRYDNRSLGESDWLVKEWKNNKYTLEDMARDGIAILDKVGVEKAHIIGVSMGGMISQRMAISHSERVLSMTSIMSSGYFHDETLPPVPRKFMIGFVRAILLYGRDLTKMENKLKLHVSLRKLLLGKGYTTEDKYLLQKALYENTKRKGYNATARDHHGYAIKKSGSRYSELGQITTPTLVIHGKADTLVLFPHGEKYAEMIPNAEKLFFENMGHDISKGYAEKMIDPILKNFEKAEKIVKV